MRKLVIAGAGTGDITREVQDALMSADTVYAAGRFRYLVPAGRKFVELKDIASVLDNLADETGQAAILVSGDPGVYSLLPLVKKRLPDEQITVLPGVSSLQVLCARVCELWSDAVILSGHGRTLRAGRLLNLVERNRLVILFCDGVNSPGWACRELTCIEDIDVVIGEELGSETERVLTGKPRDFAAHDSPELSLMLIRNARPFVPKNIHPRDREFARAEGVVMTNEAVRSVILGRLNLSRDSVLWDIGAGTGTISVSAGLEFPESEIHAVECKPEGATVIGWNARMFHLHNVDVHFGRALGLVERLPEPTHVFVGGSGGELSGIIRHIAGLKKSVRVVIACVTLETLNEAYSLLRDWREFEAVQVSVSSSKTLAVTHTLMKAQSPVTILSALSK